MVGEGARRKEMKGKGGGEEGTRHSHESWLEFARDW